MPVTATSVTMSVVMLASKMIMTFTRVQNFHLDQVKYETHDGNDQHQVSLDPRRLEEPLRGFTDKPDSHDPDGRHGDSRSNDLSSVPAIGQVRS